ncbi:WbqC family protein [Cobetia sp. Ld8]|uniref:WbqC family protein n=1 Tax=Cobetia sp. Ld8 TaxID=649154 RepID=UPI00386418C0
MNIEIMQPSLFPHIGYSHLMHACDEFLVYDDVALISRGDINSLGGRNLYQTALFSSNGITLSFLASQSRNSRQATSEPRSEAGADSRHSGRQVEFSAGLSIIEMLMWCSPGEVRERLTEYQLLPEDLELLRAAGNVAGDTAPVSRQSARVVAAHATQGGLASCH